MHSTKNGTPNSRGIYSDYSIETIGKPAEDDLKLGAMELKAKFKLMMVGSLEADIEDVCNVPFHNRDVIDDFEDDNDDKCPMQFHNMEVNNK